LGRFEGRITHADGADGFTVPTRSGRVLLVLVPSSHQCRRIIDLNITERPPAEEATLGTIEPGKLADVVVLSDDGFDAKRVPDTCFFCSYSRKDEAFALKLASDLKGAGIPVWIDQLDIPPGQHWDDAIQAALTSSDGILVVLSPGGVESKNVKDEVSYALDEGKRLIPVLYLECAVPLRLRRMQRVDFTRGFEQGFANLLRAIRQQPVDDRVPWSPYEAELKGSAIGGILGAIIGTTAVFLLGSAAEKELWWVGTLLCAILFALAGAVCGLSWRRAVLSTLAGVLGMFVAFVIFSNGSSRMLSAVIYGLPGGALVGAMLSAGFRTR
jgi:hypothetical protein